ncbi:acetolactate synthase [Ranunculus cassubicifolius]
MDFREISILYHVGIILVLLWICSYFNYNHPVVYVISFIYLYQVHDCYIRRLRGKVRIEERKHLQQKRLLSDSESVRWLNHAVEKVWPVCMEQIASQKILLSIAPWFLDKYKPWIVKEAVVQHLYLGKTPPMFTEMRVLRQSSDDDHLVMEFGIKFLTAYDMSATLAVKLRKILGFGLWAQLHVTGMLVEGKVLVGVKFLREWPFIGRLRVCFVEPPYFQIMLKPIINHGLDVTELPGIAGWLEKLLSVAFEETLVEPNMLVFDMEKFASTSTELPDSWFTMDEKDPISYVKVEVIEGADMKPSDSNGLADPYVKGRLGPYKFRTKTQKKTLNPKWQEGFKIPICSWDSPILLALQVCDKDHFYDDALGDCTINISDVEDGQRHDMWLPLENIRMGRLRLAITVLDSDRKKKDDKATDINTTTDLTKLEDEFEPINVEGQNETGIWVHRPGEVICQRWEPRKLDREENIEIQRECNDSTKAVASRQNANVNKSKRVWSIRRTLKKIRSIFRRNPKGRSRKCNMKGVGKFILKHGLRKVLFRKGLNKSKTNATGDYN